MYKYTAHPDILNKYDRINKNSKCPWEDHYFQALGIAGTPANYFACGDFWRHYKAMQFYSPVKRTHVPVNGVLISTEWFIETKV